MKALLLFALILGACLADDGYGKWPKQGTTVHDKDGMSQESDGKTKNDTSREGSNTAAGHLPTDNDTNKGGTILKIPAKMSEDTVASTTVIQDTVTEDSRMDRKTDAADFNTSKMSRMEKTMPEHREARYFGKSPTKRGAAERSKSEYEATGESRQNEKGESISSEATGAVGPRRSTSSKNSKVKRGEDAFEPEPRSDASEMRQSRAFKESQSRPNVASLPENLSNEPSALLASTNRSSTESANVKSLEPRTTNDAMRTFETASDGSPEKASKPILSPANEQSDAMAKESLMVKRAAGTITCHSDVEGSNGTAEEASCGYRFTMSIVRDVKVDCNKKQSTLFNSPRTEAPFQATFQTFDIDVPIVAVRCFCNGSLCNKPEAAADCIRKSIGSGHYDKTTTKDGLVDEAVHCITGSFIKDITTTTTTTTPPPPPPSSTTTTPPNVVHSTYRLRINDEDGQSSIIFLAIIGSIFIVIIVVGVIVTVLCVCRNKKKDKSTKKKKEAKKEAKKEHQRPVTPVKTPTTVSPVEAQEKRVKIGSQLYKAMGRLDVAKVMASADFVGPHSEEGKPSVEIKAITFDEAANEVHDVSDRKAE